MPVGTVFVYIQQPSTFKLKEASMTMLLFPTKITFSILGGCKDMFDQCKGHFIVVDLLVMFPPFLDTMLIIFNIMV